MIRFALIAVLVFIGGAGYAIVTDLSSQSETIATMKQQARLTQGRVDSYLRMIERRNKAIAASKCKTQIEHWVRNPDEIPEPFNPFNQLN